MNFLIFLFLLFQLPAENKIACVLIHLPVFFLLMYYYVCFLIKTEINSNNFLMYSLLID